MKNSQFINNFFTVITTIFMLGVGLLVSTGLVSCDNFLNSEDIHKQIEDAIAYNNALSSTLIFRAANGTGDFLTGSEKACKINFTVDVQFQANLTDYVYHGLEAVSSTDNSVSREDYVEFTDIGTETERNNGLHKIRIKLLKQSDDILIRPKCILIPRVTEITPAGIMTNPAGFDQDTRIKITFNKPVDVSTFKDFECVYISANDNPVMDYFNEPFFSEDDTVLNIIPKQNVHIILPDSNRRYDVTVTIDFTNIKDMEGINVVQMPSHTYRINDSFGNQEKSQLLIKNDDNSDTGAFLVTGETQCTVGYSIDVQYTINSNKYVYCGLEAVSSKDVSQSREDCVKFTDISTESEKSNGVYKTQIMVLKKAEDILVRPKCVLIPLITEITPAGISTNPSGFDQDSIIKIIFNKSVNPETFGDFECISIYSNEGDLKEYFNTPQFAEQNTQLIISPVNGKLILNPDSNKKLDITVSVDFTNIKDADGLSFAQKEPHVYRINDSFGNQKKSRLLIKDDDNSITGNFLVTGELQCTVGYSFDLQFTLAKSNYAFKSLKAVNRNNPNYSMSDTVEFSIISYDAENGIYKIRVLVKKESQDILIKPDCKPLPKVESILPENVQTGCNQDSTIVIRFNKAMNPDTFGDFDCLSIKNSDGELFSTNPAYSYFEVPYFSEDDKVLNIPTIKGKYLMSATPAGQRPMEITVNLNTSGLKDADGLSLLSVEPYIYKINQNKDDVKPVVNAISVSNETDETLWYYRTLTGKNLTQWSAEPEYESDGTTLKFLNGDYSRNHIIDKLHIKLTGSDDFSGIKCIKVKEVYEKTEGGSDTSKPEFETVYVEDLFEPDPTIPGGYTYSFDYKFRKSSNNGLYRLDFCVVDKAGNESEPAVYYVIKDTDSKRTIKWRGYLDVPYSFINPSTATISENCFPVYNEQTGKYESILSFQYFDFSKKNAFSTYKVLCKRLVVQKYNGNNSYDTVFEEKDLYNDDISEVDYAYGNLITENILTGKINNALNNLIINPDETTLLRVLIYEENGLINEYPFAIAKRARITEHKISGNSIYFYEEDKNYSINTNISVALNDQDGIIGNKKDGESEISSYRRFRKVAQSSPARDDDPFTIEKCTYYISFTRVAMTDEGRIYSAYSLPYVLYRKQNDGTFGWGHYNEHIYVPSQIDSFQFPNFTLPEKNDDNIANGIIEFPAHTGKVRFTVDVEYPQNDGYEYLIKAKWNGNVQGVFQSKTIELDNGLPYKISLVARNSDGIIVAESEEVDCCYKGPDNYPPVIDTSYLSYYKDRFEINARFIKDKDGEREKAKDDYGNEYDYHTLAQKVNRVRKLDFYFTPVDLGKNVALEELKNGNYFLYTVDIPEHDWDNAPTLKIPLHFIESGKFYLYCYLEDIAGNPALYSFNSSYGSYTIPVTPQIQNITNTVTEYTTGWGDYVELKEGKDILSVTFPKYSNALRPASDAFDGSDTTDLWINYSTYDPNTNSWQKTEYDYYYFSENTGSLTAIGDNYKAVISINTSYTSSITAKENKFTKIEIQYGHGSGKNLPVYTYPIYFYKGDDSFDYTCRNKNVMDAYNGYQVFCDKPVFAHTMYSKFKLTEGSSAADSHVWEGRGVETGLVYNDGTATTFSYTDSQLTEIPEGCYYTTIFHFVDGTSIMTPVKQKN